MANFLKSKGVTGDIATWISCNAGQCNLAQNLANKLNVTVETCNNEMLTVPIDSQGHHPCCSQVASAISIYTVWELTMNKFGFFDEQSEDESAQFY